MHIWCPLWGGLGVRQKWDVIGCRGWGVASVLGVQSLFLFKENCISAMTRHRAEPNTKILLTRNLPFDSDVRQLSRPLMIQLHCLWITSNNWTCGQFECDVTRFCFDFVRSHGRYYLERDGLFKIRRPRSREWNIFGRRSTEGVRSLEN